MKTKKRIVVFLGMCLCFIFLAACGGKGDVAEGENENKEIQNVNISTDYIGYTLEEMITESTLVLEGTVSGISDAFAIANVNGGSTSNFTDYTIDVKEVYRCDPEMLDSSVVIRIQGGSTEDLNVICDNEAILEKDKTYTFFLYQPGLGGNYNTEGDYYYVIGGKQGVCSAFSDTEFQSQAGEIFTISEFNSLLTTVNENSPANQNYYKDMFYADMKEKLESGATSQEEYDATIEAFETYAQIVE